jgi:hypothetical protein
MKIQDVTHDEINRVEQNKLKEEKLYISKNILTLFIHTILLLINTLSEIYYFGYILIK